MKIEVENIRKHGGNCNFCNRGELNVGGYGYGLIYPYDIVYTFMRDNGNGLKASICQDCINELFEKTKSKGDTK